MARATLFWTLFFFGLFYVYAQHNRNVYLSKEYCVVGAGPASLQMGYFMKRAGNDYILFEKSQQPGTFFMKYPRHRKLISINKRNTGRKNSEFNLRHDWNSLISDDDSLLVGKYTKNYFPHADVYVRYLSDYQKKLGINVQFNTTIGNIRYRETDERPNDDCRYTMSDQEKRLYCCKNVIIGTGWSNSKVPPHIKGAELLESYDDISIEGEDFEGKSVLIFGLGNSAFETALSMMSYANVIHLAGRRRVRLSWETHYVGDLRGLNNEILDNYMLKSLDGLLELEINELKFTKRNDGKIQLVPVQTNSKSHMVDKNPVRDGYDHVILCLGFLWNSQMFHPSMKISSSKFSNLPKNKFPAIDYDFQVPNYKGLYFIGTLAHSLDFRKSAGGFVHGFRYAVRALHRQLQWQNHGKKWPTKKLTIRELPSRLLKRANEASGIYQMFSFFCDIAIYNRNTEQVTYLEEFPVPLLPKLATYSGHSFQPNVHDVFIMAQQYGHNFSQIGVDHFSEERAQGTVEKAHLSNFLHPVIYYYKGKMPCAKEMERIWKVRGHQILPTPDGVHHVLEDFTTQFDGPSMHLLPLRRFVEHYTNLDLRTFPTQRCMAYTLTLKASDGRGSLSGCASYLSSKESSLVFA